GTADRNRSHWSTSKTPSYTKSVSWQHHPVIVHIKGMASSELFENILSGDSLVVRIIPALLAGVVMSRIITRLPGLDISCPETDSLS
ncbi:hypothetical protein ODR95_20350, partial [Escherichia coli]|nr:hypothetical protein [Escherichia coli]